MSVQREQLSMEPCGDGAVTIGSAVARKLLAALELVAAALFATILAVTALRRRRQEPARSLQGCKVLITAADSNFGRSLVSHFSQQGCRVAEVIRPDKHTKIGTESLTCCIKENSNNSDLFFCDIGEPIQLTQLALSVKERLDRIDILICQSVVKKAEAEADCKNELDSIARLVSSEVKTHLSILQSMLPLVEEKTGHVVIIPTSIKHSTAFRDTQEALVDLMTSMADQMTQSHGVGLTCARLKDSGNPNNDIAALRLIEAIQKKTHSCDLSCNKFQEIIQSSFRYVIKAFWRHGNEEIKTQ